MAEERRVGVVLTAADGPAVGAVGPADATASSHRPVARLVVERQVLELHDHGSGLPRSPAAAVLLTADEADAVVARVAQDRPVDVVDLPTIRFDLRPHPGGGSGVEVRLDGAPLQTWPMAGAEDSLLTWVTRARLHEDQRRPRLHAAALTDTAGRAVVVLGDPGAGKSTLTAHLAHGGLDLVTDEQLTVFADHGLVGAFTRPVLLKRPSLDHLPAGVAVRDPGDHHRLVVPAASLGSRHRLWGRPVLVVLPERSDDHQGAPTWDRLAPAEALAELCGHNLDLVRKPVAALDAFAWLAATVPLVRLRYGDAVDAAPVVAGLLAEPPTHDAVAWLVSDHPTEGTDPSEPTDLSASSESSEPSEPSESSAQSEPSERSLPSDSSDRAGASDEPAVASGLAPAPGVVTAVIGQEVVLFEPVGRGLVRLNADGARLWATLPWTVLPWEHHGAPEPAPADDALAATYDVVVDLVARGFAAFTGEAGRRYRRVAGLVSRRLGTQELVSDPDHRIARLDGAAATVWRTLVQPARADEVAASIASHGAPAPWARRQTSLEAGRRVGDALRALEVSGLVFSDAPG